MLLGRALQRQSTVLKETAALSAHARRPDSSFCSLAPPNTGWELHYSQVQRGAGSYGASAAIIPLPQAAPSRDVLLSPVGMLELLRPLATPKLAGSSCQASQASRSPRGWQQEGPHILPPTPLPTAMPGRAGLFLALLCLRHGGRSLCRRGPHRANCPCQLSPSAPQRPLHAALALHGDLAVPCSASCFRPPHASAGVFHRPSFR